MACYWSTTSGIKSASWPARAEHRLITTNPRELAEFDAQQAADGLVGPVPALRRPAHPAERSRRSRSGGLVKAVSGRAAALIDTEALKRERPLADVIASSGIACAARAPAPTAGCVPFTQERTPSFWVDARDPDDEHYFWCAA